MKYIQYCSNIFAFLDNGMILPRGSSVQINAFLIHRNPQYFMNPEEFDPDRFFNQTIQPYTFLAFSGGVRNCIGQSFAKIQEKVILAFLLSRYEILPGQGMENVEFVWDLVLRPKFGAVVKLRPLSTNNT
jgi:cytochrome P450